MKGHSAAPAVAQIGITCCCMASMLEVTVISTMNHLWKLSLQQHGAACHDLFSMVVPWPTCRHLHAPPFHQFPLHISKHQHTMLLTLQVRRLQRTAAACQQQAVPAPARQKLRRTHTAAAAASAAPADTQQPCTGLDMPEGFDLPVAIALAAAAFEAYLEPVGANDEFQEVTVNNTHVTYTDRCVMPLAG